MGLKKRMQGPTVQGINRSTCLHTKRCEDGPGQIPVTLGTCTRTGSSREKAGGNSTRKVHKHGPRHQDIERQAKGQRQAKGHRYTGGSQVHNEIAQICAEAGTGLHSASLLIGTGAHFGRERWPCEAGQPASFAHWHRQRHTGDGRVVLVCPGHLLVGTSDDARVCQFPSSVSAPISNVRLTGRFPGKRRVSPRPPARRTDTDRCQKCIFPGRRFLHMGQQDGRISKTKKYKRTVHLK